MTLQGAETIDSDVVATRFFYVVGEVALRHYIFLDGTVLKHMKASKTMKGGLKGSSSKQQNGDKNGGENENELEMALGCATAPDVESDAVIGLLNNLVTDPSYLLTNFIPILSQDAMNEEPSFATLLCLVKFMLVSQPVAQVLMPIFEKALDKFLLSESTKEASKNSLLVGLADLFIRFPTITGKISEVLFSCLHTMATDEASSELRQTALIIVSYLAMNDMLRIRDHLADIAVATLDRDPTIRTLSKELITEIATKNNALYNAMANILSRLAAPVAEGGLIEDDKDFDEIVGFLFKLVTKDRQTDMLLARILSQMKTVSDVRFARRLAMCVLHLPLTERSLSIFNTNFVQMAEHIVDDEVFSKLSQAMTKLKQANKKSELADQIDEFLVRLASAHDPDSVKIEPGDAENLDPTAENEENDSAEAASKAKTAPGKLVATPGPRRGRKSTVETPLEANKTKRTAKTTKSAKADRNLKTAATIRGAAKKRAVIDSDSE